MEQRSPNADPAAVVRGMREQIFTLSPADIGVASGPGHVHPTLPGIGGPVLKDATILAVIDRLRGCLGADAFLICDHWEADLCAIGLAARDEPRRLVYICTHDMPAGRYFVSLELPPTPGHDVYTPAGDHDDVNFEELVRMVQQHLRLE